MGHLPEDTRTTFADIGKEDCMSETRRSGAEKEHRQPVNDTRFRRTRVFDRGPSYTVTGEEGTPEGSSPDILFVVFGLFVAKLTLGRKHR